MFPKQNTRQRQPNSQVTKGWISILRASSPEADGPRSPLGLHITDTEPLGQSKEQNLSRCDKHTLRTGRDPFHDPTTGQNLVWMGFSQFALCQQSTDTKLTELS